jgi:hypothetical protein
MHTFFLILHSWMRWVVILMGLWAWISAFQHFASDKHYVSVNRRSGLLFMISCDLQLLIGIILYVAGGWLAEWEDMSQAMGQPALRFFTVEHETLMMIAWILVHVGWSSVKKAQADRQKLSRSLVFFGIALLLILIATPWPFREVARPWLRT